MPTLGLKESLLLRLAKRWISGVDSRSALDDASVANSKGMKAVINYLGEEIRDKSVAEAHFQEYVGLQRAISAEGINGCVTVKLTQFGLGFDDTRADERLRTLVKEASRLSQDLWIDMEGSSYLERTIDVYLRSLREHDRLGLALQAYLRRSEQDLRRLLDAGAMIRLVKGAYRESHDLIFPTRAETTANFSKLMRILFDESEKFVIATHDSKLIEEARRLSDSSHANFEFHMLKGIRDELKAELLNSGYKVGEYVPYGDLWYSYSKRRITEHPRNILLLLRSLV